MAHEKLRSLGYAGSERTTRRAVAAVKAHYRAGRVRVHWPWITEPGMWLQYDFAGGPARGGGRERPRINRSTEDATPVSVAVEATNRRFADDVVPASLACAGLLP